MQACEINEAHSSMLYINSVSNTVFVPLCISENNRIIAVHFSTTIPSKTHFKPLRRPSHLVWRMGHIKNASS